MERSLIFSHDYYTTFCLKSKEKSLGKQRKYTLLALVQTINFTTITLNTGYKIMPYYKTEIEAGKTIEVIKSHTRSLNDHRPREGREKITPEDMKKINRINTEAISKNYKC